MSSSSSPPLIASFTKPVPEAGNPGVVWIYHPLHNLTFLSIPVRNCPLPDGTQSDYPCIPLTTLLDACYIVTGMEGILAFYDGDQQVVHTGLVAANRYYYIVSNDRTVDYDIFHSFDAWVPPQREQVPDYWFTGVYPRSRPPRPNQYDWNAVSGQTVNTLREKARSADGACRLSGFPVPIEAAHIVPEACRHWYQMRRICLQLHWPESIPRNLAVANAVHDIRNYITLRPDLHERWDAHAFVFIPVDGYFIAYYITPGPELQATDFHCARLNTPERTDGYLLYIRFAYSIFQLLVNYDSFEVHPNSSPVSIPPTPEDVEMSAGSGLPPFAGPSEAVEFDPNAGMDSVTAAKHIIDWYSDVEREDLPADLACAWRDLIDDKEDNNENTERLKREWLERQRRQMREDRPESGLRELVQDSAVGSQDSGRHSQ
ncbi:hypothetical protein L226DRAFT_616911 [Lentinus tigrinus ALCF2SS1-7]|uniref:HNH nuclease domain-containing protein n=1 Tax=Lentinus tigrinus ALCF2SS1-6 TaxID=1328759 RepID=A0A5C2RSD1_9APHY|nr:hypothetical protein L227DRAFT_580505 [Lentinus tigrinus ALCF2SS1-6]RPD69381.1 hypothetical protein L226DRAFT_616911 [Lentinus tigrinus ALCF2SS1-7]